VYYREASAILLVFDTTDASTLAACDLWKRNIRAYNEKAWLFLVANKCEDRERRVRTAEGKEWGKLNRATYVEVSAKTDEGISDLFRTLAETLDKGYRASGPAFI
jgi:GTPase SAR1 family protein